MFRIRPIYDTTVPIDAQRVDQDHAGMIRTVERVQAGLVGEEGQGGVRRETRSGAAPRVGVEPAGDVHCQLERRLP